MLVSHSSLPQNVTSLTTGLMSDVPNVKTSEEVVHNNAGIGSIKFLVIQILKVKCKKFKLSLLLDSNDCKAIVVHFSLQQLSCVCGVLIQPCLNQDEFF